MEITENSSSDEEIEPKSSSSQTQTHPPSYLEGLSVNQQIEVLYSESIRERPGTSFLDKRRRGGTVALQPELSNTKEMLSDESIPGPPNLSANSSHQSLLIHEKRDDKKGQNHHSAPLPSSSNWLSYQKTKIQINSIKAARAKEGESKRSVTGFVHVGEGKQIEIKDLEEKTKLADENGLTSILNLVTFSEGIVREQSIKILSSLILREKNIGLEEDSSYYLFRDLVLHPNESVVLHSWLALEVLSNSQEQQLRIVPELGCDCFKLALSSTSNIKIQKIISTVISTLALHAQNRKDFTTLEILPILLNIALSSDNLSLNRSLSAAIANLLHESENAVQINESGWETIFNWFKVEDVVLNRGAVTCIANIAYNDEKQIKKQLRKYGALSHVSKFLSSSDFVTQKSAAMAIANLTVSKKNLVEFLKLQNIFQTLVNIGKTTNDLDVILSVLMTLSNCSGSVDPSQILKLNVIDFLKKCSNSEDDDLQREALAVLTVIKPDEIQEVSLSFFHSSSLQKNKLVKVMTEIDSQQLLKQLTEMDFSYALKQLKHYASRVENVKRIISNGGIPIIVNSFKRATQKEEKVNLLKLVKRLIIEETVQNVLREKGIIPILQSILQTEFDDAIIYAVLEAMTLLSLNNTKTQLLLKQSVPNLVSIFQSTPSTKVKQGVIRVIGALCFKNRKLHASMRKAGMIKLIMPCMSTYVSDNPLLQRDSIGFIRLIAEDDLTNQDIIRKEGGIPILAKVLEASTSDEKLKALCCLAGSALTQGPNAKNQTQFRTENVISSLIQLLATQNQLLLACASFFVLEMVRDNNKNQETFCLTGGVPITLKVLSSAVDQEILFNLLGVVWYCSRGDSKRKSAFKNAKAHQILVQVQEKIPNDKKEMKQIVSKLILLFENGK